MIFTLAKPLITVTYYMATNGICTSKKLPMLIAVLLPKYCFPTGDQLQRYCDSHMSRLAVDMDMCGYQPSCGYIHGSCAVAFAD